jgi:hypothetical protein
LSKSLSGDLVEEWQRLMIEWDAACAAYAEACKASPADQPIDAGTTERNAAIATALARLNDIKRRIDAVVTGGGKRRDPNRQDLIVGTIEQNAESTASDSEDTASGGPPQVTPKSGRK